QLEHEVFQALRGGAQLDEHATERLRNLADLVDLAEPGDLGRRALGRGRGRALHRGRRRAHRLSERASKLRDARGEPAEQGVAQARDGEPAEDARLDVWRLQEPQLRDEVEEDQEWKDGGQRKEGARGLAELHRALTRVFTRVLLV